jgi:hypothetical protein
LKVPFHHLVYLLVLLFVTASCQKSSQTVPATTVNSVNYNAISLGMPYAQVIALLGQGTQVNANTYVWSADDTNTITITVEFSSANVVQFKTQMGVVSSARACPASVNGYTVFTEPNGGCYYLNNRGNKAYL